jgi:hypothetical protein
MVNIPQNMEPNENYIVPFSPLEAKPTNETSSHSRFFKIHRFVKEASMGLHNDMNVVHTYLNCLLQKLPLIERSQFVSKFAFTKFVKLVDLDQMFFSIS